MKKLIAALAAMGAAAALSAQVHFGVGARGTFGFGLGSSTDVYNTSNESYWDAYNDENKLKGDDASNWDPAYDPDLDVKYFESILAGGAIVGRVSFDAVPGLFLQPEIGFSHNQVKYSYDWEWSKNKSDSWTMGGVSYSRTYRKENEEEGGGSLSYNSIDIPIIVGYEVEIGHGMVVSPYAGLNLSIPVGSLSWSIDSSTYSWKSTTTTYGSETTTETDSDSEKYDGYSHSTDIKNGVIPGIVLGAGFGYKFDSHNMVMADLRYLMDFTAVKAGTDAKAWYNDMKDDDDPDWSSDNKNFDFDFDALIRRGLTIGVNYVYFF